MGVQVEGDKEQISQQEFSNQIIGIIVSLSNFKTQEAVEKSIQLRNCELPDEIQMLISKAIDYLKDYDDENAEKTLWEAKRKMEKMNAFELEKHRKEENEHAMEQEQKTEQSSEHEDEYEAKHEQPEGDKQSIEPYYQGADNI
jgi:hypothetical protein